MTTTVFEHQRDACKRYENSNIEILNLAPPEVYSIYQYVQPGTAAKETMRIVSCRQMAQLVPSLMVFGRDVGHYAIMCLHRYFQILHSFCPSVR